MGAVMTLEAVTIDLEACKSCDAASTVQLETSTDQKSWATLDIGGFKSWGGHTLRTTILGRRARYVRVKSSSDWWSVWEVYVAFNLMSPEDSPGFGDEGSEGG